MNNNCDLKTEFALRTAVETLETVKRQKARFFIPNIEAADNFLTGFCLGMIAVGIPITFESWHVALGCRGWRWTSVGVIPSMKAAGLTDEQITNELIDSLTDTIREEMRKMKRAVLEK